MATLREPRKVGHERHVQLRVALEVGVVSASLCHDHSSFGSVPWCVRITGDHAPSSVQRKKSSLVEGGFVADW